MWSTKKKKKERKNTQKKIKKEKELGKEGKSIWLAGAPRPKQLLMTLGVENLVQIGMF